MMAAGRREHLRHAGAALGAFVADDDHVALVDLALLPAPCSMSSSLSKTLAGPVNCRPSLPVILATAPSGARLPRRMRMWPSFLIGLSSG